MLEAEGADERGIIKGSHSFALPPSPRSWRYVIVRQGTWITFEGGEWIFCPSTRRSPSFKP